MAHEHGYISRKDDYLTRLRRIEGQARGLQRMVDEEKYCIDILTQVSAMTKALHAVSMGLLEDHMNHCVVDAARAGDDEAREKVAEAAQAIARLVRPEPGHPHDRAARSAGGSAGSEQHRAGPQVREHELPLDGLQPHRDQVAVGLTAPPEPVAEVAALSGRRAARQHGRESALVRAWSSFSNASTTRTSPPGWADIANAGPGSPRPPPDQLAPASSWSSASACDIASARQAWVPV